MATQIFRLFLPRLRMITPAIFLLAALLLVPGATLTAAQRLDRQGQTVQLPADLYVLTEQGQVMLVDSSGSFASPVTPAEQQVVDFGVAPDGQWIAYRTPDFVAITSVNNLGGQVLEFDTGQPPITGRGQTLVWSPDGAAIAYTTAAGIRIYLAGLGELGGPLFQDLSGGPFLNLMWSPGGSYLAAEAENDAWTVFRRDIGSLAEIAQIPSSAGMAWMREGVLAVAPPGGGLFTLNLADGSQAALVGREVVVSQPTPIPGGRLIFLVHESGGQGFAARRFGTISMDGSGYEEVEATLEMTAMMRWLPDGVALLASLDGTLTLIEPRTDSRRELMESVKAYAWGPLPLPEVSGVNLPADLYFIASDEAGIAQVWRLPADSGPAEAVTAETESVIDFGISRDGAQIAYTAGTTLYAANLDGSNRRELSPSAGRPGAGTQPAWSPDGRLVAFARNGIWIVPSVGGARTELITDVLSADTPPDQVRVYSHPRWSPDGVLLLVSVGYYEGGAQAVLSVAGGEAMLLPIDATQGAWLPNRQILAWDYGGAYVTPGLYLINSADLSTAITVLDDTWNVYDAMPLANEAAVILRAGGAWTMGPGSIQPFLIPLVPAALAIPRGQGGLIDAPILSPGGTFAAGLRDMNYGDYGPVGGLTIIHLETGERFAVETPGNIWALQWGTQP